MAAIKLVQFGGLAPSVDPRNLAVDGAQVAENLDMRFGDFRPSKGPGSSVATVPAGTQSIFRTPDGTWLSSTTDTDYVNSQVNDAAQDRVYLTGRSAYPEAWQGGTYRRLGVPAPAAKPTVVLQAVDEFTREDATIAQEAALTAVLLAVNTTATNTLLGNAPPAGVGTFVPDPDPLYASVALHLDFNSLVSGEFVDKSPQKAGTTKETGVTLSAGTDGPLGTPGGKYGVFAGGTAGGVVLTSEIRRWRTESNPRWTVDAWVTSSVALEWVTIQCRDGNIREILFQETGGAYHCLTSSVSTGAFSEQLRCKRPGGADAMAANTPTLVSVQCTGTTVQVYLDGVLCGSTPNAEGLELTNIGRSQWTNTRAWVGKMDEFRVTLEQRYTADFTPPTAPYSTAAVPTGFFVAHGDPLASGLPTVNSQDSAYLVQLSLVSGAYVTTNPADEYLRTSALSGAQVTYSGSQYWAVSVAKYRANAKAMVEVTLQAALAAVDNPASPGTPLLTAPQATSLATSIYALYNPAVSPLLPLVTAVNTKQAELSGQLASPTDAAAVATKLTLLQSASTAIEGYFSSMDAKVTEVLTTSLGSIFGSISSKIVNRNLDTRAYIVTYLTDWDEESAPSAPSDLLDVDQNDSVMVTADAPPGGRNIVAWRLYRSNTGNAGGVFELVTDKEAPNAIVRDGAFIGFTVGNLVYTDSKPSEELQETCQTLTWLEPPENLEGLVGMPNGVMAGFFGKTLCFCVPFAGYAWPIEFQHSLEFDIVAIRVFGQTAVVLTKGNPYFASGADSASMSTQKLESPQACIAKRTAVSVEGGVLYASPDGLCLASASGIQVLTQGTFDRADWLAAVGDGSFGAFHDGAYYLFAM